MSSSFSPALPIAHLLLRVMIVLNWLMGAAILLLLIAMPIHDWIPKALGFAASPAVVGGLIAIAGVGLIAVPLRHLILRRLLAIVETVRAGDPFVPANADRLQGIAWILLALQLLGLVVSGIAKGVSTREHPIALGDGFSLSGWLAVLLTFVLASIFSEATRMRADLEGTV